MAKNSITVAVAMVCVNCIGCVAEFARAQCDYSLTTFASSDLDGYGPVRAMTVFDDGSGPALIVGGMEIMEVPGGSSLDYYNVMKWTPRGGWTPLAQPNELNYVGDLQVFENELYAAAWGGVFRWTGTAWVHAGQGMTDAGTTPDLVVFDDGSGTGPSLFLMANIWTYPPGQYATGLYKLSGGAWQPVARFNDRFTAATVFSGRLIVGGLFTAVDGVPVNHVAAWNGREWTDLGEGVVSFSDLIEHTIDGSAALVASGSFVLEDDGGTATDVAYWNGNGWRALPAINAINQDEIGVMTVWNDGNGEALYAVITIQAPFSGDLHDELYRLDPTTQQWQFIAGAYDVPYAYISCMLGYNDGTSEFPTLFVGGKFERFGAGYDSIYIYNLARILPHPKGGSIEPLPSDPRALHGNIRSFAQFDDGTGSGSTLYAGGAFGYLHHSSPTLVAQFTGESWTSVGYGYGYVKTLKVLDDGGGPTLYAAGTFSSLYPNDGQVPSHIAKWDGLNWMRMGTIGSSVSAMCVHDDGSGPAIYVLSDIGVKKWNPKAGTWSSVGLTLGNGGQGGAYVNALTSFDDGSGPALYIGGDFETVNGAPASNIARWRGPAQGWSVVGAGLSHPVTILHVHDDGASSRLLASGGGGFGSIVQWDGAAWSTFGNLPPAANGTTLQAMATLDDGAGPVLIASYHSATTRWNGSVWGLVAEAQGTDALFADPDDGVLYLGDPFAIWAPGGNPLSISGQFGGGSYEPGDTVALQVSIVQGGAVTYQWRRNGMPLTNVSGYSGTNTDRLNIGSLNGSHEGMYDVVVSNDCTSVISDSMEIDVIGTCPGDITADGLVDVDDLIALLLAWGSCPQTWCPADLTHDGVVSVDDLLTIILRWGICS